jgi:hypothetical protein
MEIPSHETECMMLEERRTLFAVSKFNLKSISWAQAQKSQSH